jgi:hypothetical protein
MSVFRESKCEECIALYDNRIAALQSNGKYSTLFKLRNNINVSFYLQFLKLEFAESCHSLVTKHSVLRLTIKTLQVYKITQIATF